MLFEQYKSAENFLESLGNMSNVNFFAGTSNPEHHFARAKHLLKLAGNPDHGLKIIHVAGTSGKGSTANYIYNILQRAGFKVGGHFSPFVSVATEKIQINGQFISAREFIDLVEEIKPVIQKCHETFGPPLHRCGEASTPSYFECCILMALLYFKKNKCDYVVLEVGLGGRFDATNAVEKTLVSVITSIGFDHMHILGNTLPEIAFEKAGIIRHGGLVVSGVDEPEAQKVIRDICKEKKAKLFRIEKDVADAKHTNTITAATVCHLLGIPQTAIEAGLTNAKPLPARFEILQKHPLVVMDGAHNPDKLNYLANLMYARSGKGKGQGAKGKNKNKKQNEKNKIHLICALTDHKNIHDCYKKIARLADFVYATRPLNAFRKFANPTDLAREIRKIKRVPTQTFLDPNAALDAALKRAKPDDVILITGSFFLCSDLRKRWISEEAQLTQRTSFPKASRDKSNNV